MLRRRRRVAFRCEPRGPPPPRFGSPPRLGPPGAPGAAPGRDPVKLPPGPPGREGPPLRGAPIGGRELVGRGPEGPMVRAPPLGMGRRAPGGGGMGRPVELSGRPGGGGMGRPVELSGGRVDGAGPSPDSGADDRCVGRMVVGPSGEIVRVGSGFATIARLRTTLVVSGVSVGTKGVGVASVALG